MSKKYPGGIITKSPATPTGPLQNGTAPGIWTIDQANYWITQGLWPTAGNFLAVEDVFSTYVYAGNNTSQTITNGINLSGQGGMVWTKDRTSAYNNVIVDSTRSLSQGLITNNTNPNTGITGDVTSFNSNGYSLGNVTGWFNNSGDNYVSWTFRKAANFFDVVTWTGNGSSGRTISHNLGVAPGCVMIKRTDSTGDWTTWHRSLSGSYPSSRDYLFLNSTAATTTAVQPFTVAPSATELTLSASVSANSNGATYVAYLYAHDTSSTGIIQCGSYTGNGSSTGPTVNLGWEPQWLLVKGASGPAQWYLIDNMRGMALTGNGNSLYPNTSQSENQYWAANFININSTGFQVVNTDSEINASGSTYIYIAIRRGPMRTPTLGTTVFSPSTSSATTNTQITTNFPVDMQFPTILGGGSTEMYVSTRLTGVPSTQTTSNFPYLNPRSTAAETSFNIVNNWNNTGFAVSSYYSGSSQLYWNFRRAPGFFDVVCYSGIAATRTVTHNLGVAPELIIVKNRTTGGTAWPVWASLFSGTNESFYFNTTAAKSATGLFTTTPPTSTVFTVGNDSWINDAGNNYISYLFASCPGVSKVGSYTGTGALQTINCGFTTGARFVLIKRTDSTGAWYVWDSARGISSGNDPYVLINSAAAQVTGTNYVDTDTTGFKVTAAAPADLNASGGTYIFLAVA